MRACFDLQNAQFSEQSQEQITIPSKQSMDMYNQQYYLLFKQAKQFFADCKDSVSRLIALNSMGFGFNLPFIMSTFIGMENKWINGVKNVSEQNPFAKKNKEKYSQSFYSMLYRMGELIDDLINLQVDIKKNYMGLSVEKPVNLLKKEKSFQQKESFRSDGSGSSTDIFKNSIKKSLISEQVQKQHEKQQKIRNILKKNIKVTELSPKKVCKPKSNPNQNLTRLSSKLQTLKCKITADRQKEQRVWQTFNKKKPSSYQFKKHKQQQNKSKSKNKRIASVKILDNVLDSQIDVGDDLEQTASIRTKNTVESVHFGYFEQGNQVK